MKTVTETINKIKQNINPAKRSAFISVIIFGIVAHLTVMVSDWPNHDGVASIYFDQNMITSGRWFLTVACGLSTYFTLPWIIGLLSLIYIGIAAMLIVDITEVENSLSAILIGGMLATFPALASTFAYVFTMDGYMIGLMLAVGAVAVTKNYRFGWIAGAFMLAFSMGTYQAYLPFAVILCMYGVILVETSAKTIKEKIFASLRFLYMGVCGAGLYYVILQVLLKIQGKELDTYQGINGLESGVQKSGIINTIKYMYVDFAKFTIKSKVLTSNIYSVIAIGLLLVVLVYAFIYACKQNKWYKSVWMYITIVIFILALPLATNIVLLVSPEVNYHLIMRYQWVLMVILPVAFADRFTNVFAVKSKSTAAEKISFGEKTKALMSWLLLVSGAVLVLSYILLDNVGYSNLSKKYERTYAYCERLLSRIEQTEGYYQGIPIAMIGVVSTDQYPGVDVTVGVTDNMIGMYGDYLLYKNTDYELFMENYLGASLNLLSGDIIAEIYYSKEYMEMHSFPAEDSIKIVNGIMYIKTENMEEE